MLAKERIQQALEQVKPAAAVRAGQIFKGYAYDGAREAYGWWFQPFAGQPTWLGRSVVEAREIIGQIGSAQE